MRGCTHDGSGIAAYLELTFKMLRHSKKRLSICYHLISINLQCKLKSPCWVFSTFPEWSLWLLFIVYFHGNFLFFNLNIWKVIKENIGMCCFLLMLHHFFCYKEVFGEDWAMKNRASSNPNSILSKIHCILSSNMYILY